MNSFTRTSVFTIMVTGLVMLASAGSAVTPEGVSPGAVDRVATIRGECPTFSWEAVRDAAFYEVVVYELPEIVEPAAGFALSEDREVLYTRIAGGATGWTPDLERCFTPGGSYVWFARAVFDEEGGLEAGEWSQGLFFSVAAAPSANEVRRAVDVLRRHLEQGGGEAHELGMLLADPSAPATLAPTGRIPPGKLGARILPGSAAIKGEMPDLSGETYGVYGVTNSTTAGSIGVVGESTAASGEVYGIGGITDSAEGAGVIAYNAADGPDLQLVSDSAGSAWLTEAGLDRNFPGPVTFNFENSAPAGSMTLQIDGAEVVTALTDQDTLGGLSCVHDQIAKWDTVLSQWECSDDVDTDTDTLGGLACGAQQIPKWSGTFWFCSPDDDTTYSDGNQLNLVGTTFNVVEGSGSGLDADTLDSHNTDYFATAVHTHLGQTWTGSATHGLKAENSAASGFGLIGWATVPTGASYGVFGKSNSTSGYGVWGWADSATGETYGVSGLSSSQSGYGVHGEASHATGLTRGVSGESSSTNGIGVYGEATASSGGTYGVYGVSSSTAGDGVFGSATAPSGTTHGVTGRVDSPDGYGGWFANYAGGAAIYAADDVVQPSDANGVVKAAVAVRCSTVVTLINRSFNNVPGSDPMTITWNGPGLGCTIDFGFDLTNRFWSATGGSLSHRFITCASNISGTSLLDCWGTAFSGSIGDYDAVILVY